MRTSILVIIFIIPFTLKGQVEVINGSFEINSVPNCTYVADVLQVSVLPHTHPISFTRFTLHYLFGYVLWLSLSVIPF